MRKLLVVVAVGLLAGCGGGDPMIGETERYSLAVTFDNSVPTEQNNLIAEDIRRFNRLQNMLFEPADHELFGLSASDLPLTAAEIGPWLQKGMAYIIGEKYDKESIKPPLTISLNDPITAPFSAIGMANFGTGLFLKGEKAGKTYSFTVNSKTVNADHPLVGVFMIGSGLFSDFSIGDYADDAVENSLVRMGVYVHERKHGDGNGDHTGFPHEECPSDHDYGGSAACDAASNGPYKVSAAFTAMTSKSCGECNDEAFQYLQLLHDDFAGRILPSASFKDPTPVVKK